MMKKEYNTPKIVVTSFEAENVLKVSGAETQTNIGQVTYTDILP